MPQSEIKMKMSLDGSGVKKTLNRTKASVQNFSKSGIAAIARFGAAFAGIGLIKSIVGLGTSAAETASKFKAVFGPAADEMNRKVQELRKTIPSTTAEMQNALATFAQMAKAFGLNETAANGFSVEMVKIAGDIASFNDLPIEEAFLKIRSAISGEFEPMKQLGIVINEARLKQEALNLSIWDGTGQMSAAQKALAVQSILIRDMGDANGDAALTADSAANRIKFLKKELIETGTTIGTTALPAILALTEGLAKMLELTKKAADFVGTNVGEMMFGVTDETIAKREKAISQYQAEKQAIKELTEAGELYKQGLFEGTLWTKGLSEKLENNKRLIEARTKAILDSANATETAKKAETKANNDALRGAKDLAGELEKQAKSEKDPSRKKALEDRLASYRNLLDMAGKLQSLQTAKPGTRGAKGGATMRETASAKYQELGGLSSADLAKRATEALGQEGSRFERFKTIGGAESFRRFDRGRMAGEFTPEQLKAGVAKKETEKETKSEKELVSINKTLSKLDSALTGDN